MSPPSDATLREGMSFALEPLFFFLLSRLERSLSALSFRSFVEFLEEVEFLSRGNRRLLVVFFRGGAFCPLLLLLLLLLLPMLMLLLLLMLLPMTNPSATMLLLLIGRIPFSGNVNNGASSASSAKRGVVEMRGLVAVAAARLGSRAGERKAAGSRHARANPDTIQQPDLVTVHGPTQIPSPASDPKCSTPR